MMSNDQRNNVFQANETSKNLHEKTHRKMSGRVERTLILLSK